MISEKTVNEMSTIAGHVMDALVRIADREGEDRDKVVWCAARALFDMVDDATFKEYKPTDKNPLIDTIDTESIVRCRDCSVPHNKWTGCPNLGGKVPPSDFYCAAGIRRVEE